MAPSLPYPALYASHAGVWLCGADGATRALGRAEAAGLLRQTPVIVINAPLVAQRLGVADVAALDLLELFAFVHPARAAVPTVKGLSAALNLPAPDGSENAAAATLARIAAMLVARMAAPDWPERVGAAEALRALARQRWPWASLVAEQLGDSGQDDPRLFDALPRWEEAPARPQPRPVIIAPAAAADRLRNIAGTHAEPRAGQVAMAEAVAGMFAPRPTRDAPILMLAEAGTGIGKTLAYLAPGAEWVADSGGTLWLSTFTKALQRQLRRETARLYPDPAQHQTRVVVRKGRENYLCLLNLEDALQGSFTGRSAVFAQLVARWVRYSADGDMVGGDMPGWLPALFRSGGATALTDRRGECIYTACPHWQSCCIERTLRAAQGADIVIANHALMLFNAARGESRGGGREQPASRVVFDEGHHLHDAADAMFAAALTGRETNDMRRWVLGPEGTKRGRRRGMTARLADLIANDDTAAALITAASELAQDLPGDGWLARLGEAAPSGSIEALLHALHAMIIARDEAAGNGDAVYGVEVQLADPPPALVAAANAADVTLTALSVALSKLDRHIAALLDDPPEWVDQTQRGRLDGARGALGWRGDSALAWVGLLRALVGAPDAKFVDWGAIDRSDGRDIDVGLHRHWLDPTEPLVNVVLRPLHGALVTSATLALGDWDRADRRVGAKHLDSPVAHFAAASPFDYARQSEVLIVTDVKPRDIGALTAAFAALIEAAGGGTLGLFTAIRRLRLVHARLADRLARAGLPLYAQHVDPIDTGTLVDMLRDDASASLLGTDALRDGIDVPGHALRQVVLEGVPWSRPTVLHAARRAAGQRQPGGGSQYEDDLVRTRLAQAFGRLIRRQGDHGRFILLSAALPSRLLDAFPPATPVRRVTLDEAVRIAATPLGVAVSASLGHGPVNRGTE